MHFRALKSIFFPGPETHVQATPLPAIFTKKRRFDVKYNSHACQNDFNPIFHPPTHFSSRSKWVILIKMLARQNLGSQVSWNPCSIYLTLNKK